MTDPHKATTDAPILDVISERWSPVIFSDTPIEAEKIASLFEAARWACSSYNEQPWRYIYALKGDPGREKLESLLVEGNAWAKNAGLLLVDFAKKTFTKNGKPNTEALHDLGASNFAIALQATAMGLYSHQMVGFDAARASTDFGVPEDFVPGSMMAIGYLGDAATAPEALRKRQESPRMRNPASSFAFRGEWKA